MGYTRKIILATVALLLAVGLRPAISHGLTINSARDCDDNAVIRCGALDLTELQTGFNQVGVSQIYSNFGISQQDINNVPNTATEGVVTDKNNVWIQRGSGLCPDIDMNSLTSQNRQAVANNPNLCLVATDAMTAGRQNIAGSTPVTTDGVAFFTRPPSVSFASSSLAAFVVMNGNHQFAFAIIASCGNPVIATSVAVAPQPAVAAPTIRPSQSSAAPTQTQTQSQSQTVNVTTPASATTTPAPAVQSAVTTAPAKTLPNTGAGNILSTFGITTVIGTIGHWFYVRRKII